MISRSLLTFELSYLANYGTLGGLSIAAQSPVKSVSMEMHVTARRRRVVAHDLKCRKPIARAPKWALTTATHLARGGPVAA